MLRGLLFTATCVGCIGTTATANATQVDRPVTVEVVDQNDVPIAVAAIRLPEEGLLHPVNHVTGRWVGDAVYLKDGSRKPFEYRQTLDLEISAPGYQPAAVSFQIRKRKNQIKVALQPMDALVDREPEDDPVIAFGRSLPLE